MPTVRAAFELIEAILAAVTTFSRASDAYTDSLLGTYKWASGNLTYSFPGTASLYGNPYGSNEPLNNFGALSASQQGAARAAFANFAAVANVTFTELTGSNAANATLRLASSDAPGTAWAYMPATAAEGGDVWFNKSSGAYSNPQLGNYAFTTFLHEIGHSLGLEHPHENGMPVDRDSMEFTVMSYRSYIGASTTTGYANETWGFAQTLMMYDIAAAQHLYGANFSTNSGNTVYSWSPTTGQTFINGVGQAMPGGNRILLTVWDGGGVDTYDFSNYTTNLSIDLRPGHWTTTSTTQLARLHFNGSKLADGNIANALQFNGDTRSLIENAIGGSGHDTIIGNAANNLLRGGAGNDTIYGGAGSDTAAFTGSFAQYRFEAAGSGVKVTDLIAGRDGIDTVYETEYFAFSDRTVAQSLLLDSREPNGMYPQIAAGITGFTPAAGGWLSFEETPRLVHDVNGDGRADILGFASNGVRVSLANADGTFQPMQFSVAAYGSNSGGWNSYDETPRMVADVNNDGRGDIVGFASNGAFVALGRADGTFADARFAVAAFGLYSGGWRSQDETPRQIADVNGDGHADILGFASNGVFVSLGDGSGFFGAATMAVAAFGTNSGGWSSFDSVPRMVGDVNGDGRDDIVGFASNGVFVALSNGSTFSPARYVSTDFGIHSGWTSQELTPRALGDVNGDGRADIVGFGRDGVYVALAKADGTFGAMEFASEHFSLNGGWTGFDRHIRTTADVNGDGRSDLIGFGENQVLVQLAAAVSAAAPTSGSISSLATAAPYEDMTDWWWLLSDDVDAAGPDNAGYASNPGDAYLVPAPEHYASTDDLALIPNSGYLLL